MQTDDNPCRIVQFVGSQDSYNLVREMQGKPPEELEGQPKAAPVGTTDAGVVDVDDDDDVDGDDDGLYSSC